MSILKALQIFTAGKTDAARPASAPSRGQNSTLKKNMMFRGGDPAVH
jgi:hypothetical protein